MPSSPVMSSSAVAMPSHKSAEISDQPSSASPTSAGTPMLEIRDLVTEFDTPGGPLRANDGISFQLEAGSVLGVLGESGSGKSAMLRTILGIQPRSTRVFGQILLDGNDLLAMNAKQRRATRGRQIAMVFQDPLTALDPVYTVREQLVETIRVHDDPGTKLANARALELLELVQIPSAERRLDAYPFELSGGMRQRVVIAIALACRPKLLLADEPTTALDVTVQARVLELLGELRKELDMGVIFVTHDLAVAASVADRIAVMYAGRVVEFGTVDEIADAPAHPYTRGLIGANVEPGQTDRLVPIAGSPPNLANLPPGCAFALRCPEVTSSCWASRPELVTIGTSGRLARCIHVEATQ
jgi:oligopeptide/dipeptide ABC transporter ATP-binding protein